MEIQNSENSIKKEEPKTKVLEYYDHASIVMLWSCPICGKAYEKVYNNLAPNHTMTCYCHETPVIIEPIMKIQKNDPMTVNVIVEDDDN